MADDERSMRDTMEEVYDRMTADDPEEGPQTGLAFTGVEPDQEAIDREARRKTMGAVWDKYHGPEAEEWANADAPANWSEDARRKFADLAPDAKRMVLNEWGAVEASHYRNGRWAHYLRSRGVSDTQALDQLMTIERTLRTGSPDQKRAIAAYMLTSYGVPARQAMVDAQRGRSVRAIDAAMKAFETKADQHGKKLRPHFKTLKQDIRQLLAENPNLTVQRAYAQATARRGLGPNDGAQGKTIRQTLEETYDRIMARERGSNH